jgi:hypothetical protein
LRKTQQPPPWHLQRRLRKPIIEVRSSIVLHVKFSIVTQATT